jgi:uncharacterized membrane protein YhaH (DUF805 family)
MRGPDLFDILDPRGRANRKGLVILAAILLLAQTVVYGGLQFTGRELQGLPSWVIHSLFIWLGATALSKRLHDLSISAWWILWSAIGVVIWAFVVCFAVVMTLGFEAAEAGSSGMMIAMLVSFAPIIALTIWMHFAPGDEGRNPFGPVPGDTGFSKPSPTVPAGQPSSMAAISS